MKNKEVCECNHNLNDCNNSLIEVPKKTMVAPETFYFFCKGCHKGFTFTKNKDGEFVESRRIFSLSKTWKREGKSWILIS